MTVPGHRPVIWLAAGILWLSAIVVGLQRLMDYDNQPGVAAGAPAVWPAASRLTLDPHTATLVMLAHPRCDCTRASLAELAELLARSGTVPRTYVVFIRPRGVAAEWERTALWRTAAGIPGVTVFADEHGTEARRFGVQTSGQMLLYGSDGRLVYSGGVTGGRGRTGDNAGRAALLAALTGRGSDVTAPVFGCSLFEDVNELARLDSSDDHDAHTR
jgi:hypothetical protein